jgi:arylsulfatase A-like enzyme
MNVLVLCSDTFRYDHLGFLKRQQVCTPNLDKLAAQSAAFSDFWLCSFPTLVNRIDVFSGRYAFPLFKWGPLPHQFPVLSQVFAHHGFATALFADNVHFMRRGYDFERGFTHKAMVRGQCYDPILPRSAPMVDLPCPEERLGVSHDRLVRYRRNAYWYQQQGTNSTAALFRRAIEWFENPPRKFFAWIDAFDPHDPWDAPPEFLKHYPWDPQAATIIWPMGGAASQYTPGELENMRSLYKAEATQIDSWTGKLLEALRSKRLLDNTAVIFCSDHGYYFGEHDLIGKTVRASERTAIYEELGHIPLLIRHPEGLSAGTTISGLAQPPDIFPTALDLAGIPRVPWAQGNSLVPRLKGEPSQQKFAVSGYHPHRGRASCITVTTDEWALMYSPTPESQPSELYHMPTDPRHTRNVIAENPDIAAQLTLLISNWLDGLGVSPASKRQLLHNAPFTAWHKLGYNSWLARNRWSCWKNYRNYARVRPGLANG